MSTQRYTTPELNGRTVYSTDGEKLGDVQGVLEDETGTPQYLEIKSGWFGTKRHAIPLQGLMQRDDGDDLMVPYTKAQLESAPMLDENDDLTYDRERTMGEYYGTDVREWDDARDRWLPEEDLSRGPTPETRHPDGARDLETDITQGPTPETREALRATGADPGAAGQPGSDPRTRSDMVTPGDNEPGHAAPASGMGMRERTADDPNMRDTTLDDPGMRGRDMARGDYERTQAADRSMHGDHRMGDDYARGDRTRDRGAREATRGDYERTQAPDGSMHGAPRANDDYERTDRGNVSDEMRRRLRRWREDDPAR